jgi:hypothetical protein
MDWFVVLVIVAQVLVTTSTLPLILRSWTHTPAFNLLLSTIAKDSLDSETPKKGSTLESSDSSRLSGHRIIRLGGVAPNGAVGVLAVGSCGEDDDSGGQVGRVQKERLYG